MSACLDRLRAARLMDARAVSARLIAATTNYRHREDTCRFPPVRASSVVSESNGTHGQSRQNKYWMTGVNQPYGQRSNPGGRRRRKVITDAVSALTAT